MRGSRGYGISPAVAAGRAVVSVGAPLRKQRKSTPDQDAELCQYREALQDPAVIRQLHELGLGADTVGHAMRSRQHAYAPESRQQSFAVGRDLQHLNGRPAQSAQLPRKSGQPANNTQVEELAGTGRKPEATAKTQVKDCLVQHTDPGQRASANLNRGASSTCRSPEEIVAQMLAEAADEGSATDKRTTAKLAAGSVDDLLQRVASAVGDEVEDTSAQSQAGRQQNEARAQKLFEMLRQGVDTGTGQL